MLLTQKDSRKATSANPKRQIFDVFNLMAAIVNKKRLLACLKKFWIWHWHGHPQYVLSTTRQLGWPQVGSNNIYDI